MATLRPRPASPTPLQDLTRVSGIGAARARQLRAIGIDSLRRLATASPTALKRALSGVTETTAGRFVLQARELLKA
jgi:predicted RecB family nuclease